MAGYVVFALALLGAGMLAGYRLSWMDAYEKGREDATARARRAFDVGVSHGKFLADTDQLIAQIRSRR